MYPGMCGGCCGAPQPLVVLSAGRGGWCGPSGMRGFCWCSKGKGQATPLLLFASAARDRGRRSLQPGRDGGVGRGLQIVLHTQRIAPCTSAEKAEACLCDCTLHTC